MQAIDSFESNTTNNQSKVDGPQAENGPFTISEGAQQAIAEAPQRTSFNRKSTGRASFGVSVNVGLKIPSPKPNNHEKVVAMQ